jgi:hypothetical protein
MVYTITVHLYAKDDPTAIEKLKFKLIEASRVYRNDKETLDWHVMQSVHDPRSFTIVERYEQESVRTSCFLVFLLVCGSMLFQVPSLAPC